jgi:hypothetical protein
MVVDVMKVSQECFGAGLFGLKVVGNVLVIGQGGCTTRPMVGCGVADPIR